MTVIPVSEDGTPLEADAFVEGPEELVSYKLDFQVMKVRRRFRSMAEQYGGERTSL